MNIILISVIKDIKLSVMNEMNLEYENADVSKVYSMN